MREMTIWHCSVCTLENSMSKRRCQACQSRRSVDVAGIASAAQQPTEPLSTTATTRKNRKRKRNSTSNSNTSEEIKSSQIPPDSIQTTETSVGDSALLVQEATTESIQYHKEESNHTQSGSSDQIVTEPIKGKMSSSLGDSTNVRTCLLDHDLLQRNLRIPVFTRGSDRRQTKANVSLKLIAETSKVIEEKSTGSSIDDPMLNDNNDSSKVIAKANKLQTCSTLATTACFRTAGAKKIITVSDESIAITSNLLECKRDMFNGNGNSIESTGQNEFHHRLELNSKAPLPLSPVEPIDAPVPTQPKQATAACFLTAGARKRIPVSDESIAKARKVLERERKMSKKNTNTNAKKPEEESVSCNPLKPKALQAPPQLLPTDFSIEPFSAHQKEVTTVCSRTDGARKTTSVLNESMANAIRLRGRGKEMSNEIAESSAFSKPRNPDLNLPLRFKVDPTSPSTGDSIQTWISTMPIESCTACFRTAGSRKTISVSDESISNATRLLERGNSRGNDGSSRSAQLNESHLSPPSNLNAAKTSRNELLPSQSIESNTICFQTAGTGKVIKVTEDSITTATNLLERGEAMAFHSQPSKDTFRSNSNVKIGPTLPPLSVIESTWPVDTSVASFQTAGAGKKIIVSDESIATATKLMERGIYMSSGNSKSTDSIKKKESSRRLGMKSDSTSISSLQIGLQLDTGSSRAEMTVETNGGWEALPPLISTISEKDSMACFRTAGTDKTVVVEEASMKKAKILLEPKENECSGQHVARKPVVSDEPHFPLYRSSKTVNPPGKEIRNVLPCFRTAGTKKTIYVSDESIDKTTKLFELGSVFYQHDKPSESTQRNNTDVSLHTISRSVSSGPISSPTKFSKETIQPRAFFRTADIEKTICVSDATQKAAANLLECVNDTCLENGESSKGAGESYLHKSLGIVDDSKQVSACSIGTSFLTAGSGQRVTFTESSLERAEKLFSRRVENTTEAFFMAKRNSDKTTSVHAPLQQQEDPTLISGSRFTAGSCSGSSVHKQKEIYKRQKVSPVTIQFERSRKYDDKSNEEKFSEDELDLAANIGNSSNRLAPHFLIAPNKSKNSDISYADQEQAQVAVAPVTPLPHVSTPHNQLIRWGSIRRVTYGMTPASSVRKSQVGKQDTDYLSSPKRQTLSSSLPNSRMANEAKMTPYGIVTENVKSKIAMSTGTSPCRKRPLSFEENTMTPVPFNCSNEETLETTLEPQLLESTVTMMGKKGQECTSLMGAFASGEFTRHPDVCLQHGVSQVVIAVNSTNASNLCFEPKTNLPLQFTNIEKELQSVILGRVQDIREALVSEGCDSKLFSDKWILNHKRWVVWKVASYERSFSKFLGGRHLTYQNLIGNMKKRYDKEIKNGLRPAIRKVLNRDAAASRLIILIVCQILPSTGHRLGVMDSSEGYPTEPNKFKIELSDGWYSIQAALDDSLSDFVEKGWINVGTKLLISNAQLFGAEDGIEPLDSEHCPLDSNSKIGLRIRANSTRMSKWNAKLGFVNPHSFVTPGGLLLVKRLSDIIPGGGEIPIVRVFVARRYPLLYLEKSQETKTTLLTVAEEENRRREFEKRLLKAIDKLTETIETDIEKDVDEGAPQNWVKLMQSQSPEDLFQSMSEQDKYLISSWKEKRHFLIRKRVQEEVEAELETDLSLVRESVPFLRLKVQSVQESPSCKSEDALLTIWQPTEEQLSILKEGNILQFQSLSVRQTQFDGLLQLTGNSRTIIQEFELTKSLHLSLFNQAQRRFLNMFEIHLMSHKLLADYNGARPRLPDFDTVGVQLKSIHTLINEKEVCVYLSDEFGLILRIECDNSSPLPSSGQEEFPVFAFCDLRLLSFDFEQNCAVARFNEKSSLNKSTPRIEELRNWATQYSYGYSRLQRLLFYLDAKLPMWERANRISAVGHVVGLKCASSDKLHIEVDCGSSRVEEWELPVGLLEDVLPVVSQNQQVSLTIEEEERLSAFGVLESFCRAKGVLWHFELVAKPNSMASTSCNFIVSSIRVADTRVLARLYT